MKPGAPRDRTTPSRPSGRGEPARKEEGLLTSEDIFGDMVDAPPLQNGSRRGEGRRAPIRIQASEPGRPAEPHPGALLPDDVASLLDVLGASAPARSASVPAPPGAPGEADPSQEGPSVLPKPEPSAEGEPGAGLPRAPRPAPAPQPSLDELLPLPERPPRRPAPSGAGAPPGTPVVLTEGVEWLVADVSDAGSKAPAAPAGSTPRDSDTSPDAARPAGSRIPAPAAAPPAEPCLDLGRIAEFALEPRPRSTPRPARKPREGSYGPYELLERVARGGMAEVFKAKRSGVEGFEKVVAVKRILPHLSDNKEFVDMFINEAKMVAGLSHPNIVQIFDLGKIETSYYIAMEHVHGRDLRTIQKRTHEREIPVPLSLCTFVASQVCAALAYAHRKKDDQGQWLRIVHRDVSPQNILISFEGDVKLTDFGIAKAAAKASTTDKGALRGKLLFMSPEQAWGKPLDRRSDIFSLGVVLYELLSGQKPFVAESDMSVLEMVRQCRLAPLRSVSSRVPEVLDRVAMKALERDPDYRYQDAEEMQRDLERILHEHEMPTATSLARYLEALFDPEERGDLGPGAGSEEWVASGLLEPDASPAQDAEKTAPGIPRDLMSIEELLRRFDPK